MSLALLEITRNDYDKAWDGYSLTTLWCLVHDHPELSAESLNNKFVRTPSHYGSKTTQSDLNVEEGPPVERA